MEKIKNTWPILLCKTIYEYIYNFIYKYVCLSRCKREFRFFKKMIKIKNKVCLTSDTKFAKLYLEKTENFGRALIELCTNFISSGAFSKRHILKIQNIINQINIMLDN